MVAKQSGRTSDDILWFAIDLAYFRELNQTFDLNFGFIENEKITANHKLTRSFYSFADLRGFRTGNSGIIRF